jgi:O-methyltransferase involved in polyketide biosynthesis
MAHGPSQLTPGTTAALHGASLTLVTSLLARHLASSRPDPIISDPAATVLVGRLGLSALGGDWSRPRDPAPPAGTGCSTGRNRLTPHSAQACAACPS